MDAMDAGAPPVAPPTPTHVFLIGAVGATVFVVCAACIVRCFNRCGEAQRRAMRDDEHELVAPWQARVRGLAYQTIRGAPRRGSYARVPVTDRGLFVGLPA